MQNGYSTKTGESASLSRRTFMSLTASSVAVTFPALSYAKVSANPVSTRLDLLLASHAEAKHVAHVLWERVADIEEHLYAPSAVPVRVRYAWQLRGWINDDTGERDKTPLYAYSEEEIAEACMRDRALRLSMLSDKAIEMKQRVLDHCEERISSLCAELSQLKQAMDKLSDECGLTAAEDAAGVASDRRDEIAEAIAYHMPATLGEAALLAEWVSQDSQKVDCDLLFGVLANIARAGGRASGPPTMAQADRSAA